MSNLSTATDIIAGILSVTLSAMEAAQRYTLLVSKARAEGREITDAELATLRAENQALTDEVLAKLE